MTSDAGVLGSRVAYWRGLLEKEAPAGPRGPGRSLTTVLIWRPAGFFAVRNTNGRRGSKPVCNPVLAPDRPKMMEVGMDGIGLSASISASGRLMWRARAPQDANDMPMRLLRLRLW